MSSDAHDASTSIGVLNEQPLHAALKEWYAQPGDRLEVDVDGFVVDVVHGELLMEIQTGNFSAIKQKIASLVEQHPLRLVYPIARQKWLLKLPKEVGGEIERRKSPKRGRVEDVFSELVSFPELLCSETFSLEVIFIQEEEVRRHDPARRWRNRGWVTVERRLLDVLDRRLFRGPDDVAAVIPQALPRRFTTADLAQRMDGSRRLAQEMAYCLRKMGVIVQVGTRDRSHLYVLADG